MTSRITTLLLALFLIPGLCKAYSGKVSGIVFGSAIGQPLLGATVTLEGSKRHAHTDSLGRYELTGLADGDYRLIFTAEMHLPRYQNFVIRNEGNATVSISLKEFVHSLKDVTVNSGVSNGVDNSGHQVLNKIDLQLRPVNSSQDLLRTVPGLFIAQHAGGGKAEQLFLRGFDIDHGTDFAMTVDGIPVNMVSHAHGQGYADLHFIIPETIQQIDIYKGPYEARHGDLATSGAADFRTSGFLSNSMIKLEAGQFNTYRGLAMLKLLDQKHLLSRKKENMYAAAEYRYSDGYFDKPQRFNRLNLFAKYSGLLDDKTALSISASHFTSRWDASGQIPDRAVDAGIITRYGSIDSTEGGNTGRTNLNISLSRSLNSRSKLVQQLYYSRYTFSLYSNFTFYKIHEDVGDEIHQAEQRDLFGYNGRYERKDSLGKRELRTTIGAGMRYDMADIKLVHAERRQDLESYASGILNQTNASAYVDENLQLTKKIRINASARLDVFQFSYDNRLNGSLSGKAIAAKISPKLNFYYMPKPDLLFFLKTGSGFHSTDARAVILNQAEGLQKNILPRALGSDLGTTFKAGKKILVTASLWGLTLEDELVYVGDEAVVESAGRTHRLGADISIRYQLTSRLFLDGDINYSHGKLTDAPKGQNHIPLAPALTSIAGLTYRSPKGLNASLRYRYLGDRPATEDYSLTANGYFLLDGIIQYNRPHYQLGLSAENLLNQMWKEAQFETESRLRSEPTRTAVSEIHFTPGTSFFLKGSVAYLF